MNDTLSLTAPAAVRTTARMELRPATAALTAAEIHDRVQLRNRLNAAIPEAWPPETLREVLPELLAMHEGHPDWIGWLNWYGIRITEYGPILCGSVNFKGPPDEEGMVEIGYSLLPEYQGQGLATEMVQELIRWAMDHPQVRQVEAETTPDNRASIRVLRKAGFRMIGPGREQGTLRFRRSERTTKPSR